MNEGRKNILIVDDVVTNLDVLSELLSKKDYKVRPVTNAAAAFTTIENEMPDIILLDIKMPGMDGIEFCTQLKADKATADIPVIFISALGQTEDKVKAFEAGGVDYITKPFQAEEVYARVRTHLELAEAKINLQRINELLEQKVLERTSELADSNDKLFRSEEKFYKSFHANPAAQIILRLEDYSIIEANSAFEALVNYERAQLLSNSFADSGILVKPRIFVLTLERLKSGEKVFQVEVALQSKQKKLILCECYADIITIDDVTCILAVFIDVTERRKIEEERRDAESRFRAIFENSRDAIGVVKKGFHVFCNSAYVRLFGFSSQQEINAMSVLDIIAVPERDLVRKYIQNRMLGLPAPDFYETKGLRKDGTEFIMEVKVSKFVYKKEEHTIATLRDVTIIKESEQIIKDALVLNQSIFQVSPVGIIVFDEKGNSISSNDAASDILGIDQAELADLNYNAAESWRVAGLLDVITEVTASGQRKNAEIMLQQTSGAALWLSIAFQPFPYKNNDHLLMIFSDISASKKAEADLIQAKEAAEESNRLKSSFLANMSHELRTPLVGILGFAESLSESISEPQQRKQLQHILTSGKRLSATLNLILDLSSIEAQKVRATLAEVDLVSAVETNIELLQPLARKKNIPMVVKALSSSLVAMVDENLLAEIVNNLVENALKFSDKGMITIELSEVHEEGNKWAQIAVADCGIGIAREDLEIIFSEFRQASEGRGRSFEGAGLGLTIAKRLAELMHGTISVQSEIDRGSVFTLRFPLCRDSANMKKSTLKGAKKTEAHAKVEAKRHFATLYVENDSVSRELVAIYLNDICKIDFAVNAKVALEKINTNNYDLFLMDINLGRGMNGVEITKILRKMPKYEKTPVIAVTAFALVGEKEEFIEAGCDDYISKPFERAALLEVVKRVMDKYKGIKAG